MSSNKHFVPELPMQQEDVRIVLLRTLIERKQNHPNGSAEFDAGYVAAIRDLVTSFGMPPMINSDGRFLGHGVVIPAARLSVSYKAAQNMRRFLALRDQLNK